MKRNVAFIAIAVWCSILPRAVYAELPPDAYEELLKNAQEVLEVRITKVQDTSAMPSDEQKFLCDATVLDVIRSKAGLQKGATIQFKSYTVPQSVRQRGWAGPKPPPQLAVGQTWRISLNDPIEMGQPFELAAYGRSFESLGTLPTPNTSTERLGVMAMPAAGGGLHIASISRRTFADKLGLRSGDRVLEINGSPINSVAEVGPALGKDQDRLEIKFVRDGETIELTLKR